MMNALTKLTLVLAGILVGWGISWVCSYSSSKNGSDLYVELEEIFKYSTTEIKGEADSCEGDKSKTVGAVLGSIFQSNMEMTRNSVSLLCHERECGLIYDYCKPWQTQECGSRILRFGLNENMKIKPDSFVCIDAP